MTKKFKILLTLLILLPTIAMAQIVGVGTQFVPTENGANALQFQANLSFPMWTKKNPLGIYLSSGIDYTGGSSPVAGINFKPLQINSIISEEFFARSPVTIMIGGDAGYLVNHRHGKNGIVLSPHVHLEWFAFYLKSGWDFNVTGNRNQFFLRFGVGFGIGTTKFFAKTQMW